VRIGQGLIWASRRETQELFSARAKVFKSDPKRGRTARVEGSNGQIGNIPIHAIFLVVRTNGS
jgi:hypothetical protein